MLTIQVIIVGTLEAMWISGIQSLLVDMSLLSKMCPELESNSASVKALVRFSDEECMGEDSNPFPYPRDLLL